MCKGWRFTLAAVVLASAAVRADDLAGSDRILCSASSVVACRDDGDCLSLAPADLNMPQFVQIDLANKKLETTKASGRYRSTPIVNLVRSDGRIVLQGYEQGRAFSFSVLEASGLLSAAVVSDGLAVAVHGACTPLGR